MQPECLPSVLCHNQSFYIYINFLHNLLESLYANYISQWMRWELSIFQLYRASSSWGDLTMVSKVPCDSVYDSRGAFLYNYCRYKELVICRLGQEGDEIQYKYGMINMPNTNINNYLSLTENIIKLISLILLTIIAHNSQFIVMMVFVKLLLY